MSRHDDDLQIARDRLRAVAGRRAVRADGLRVDGPRADGLRADGLRADGLRADGLRADGPRADGPRADGGRAVAGRAGEARADGAGTDGTRTDDGRADGARATAATSARRSRHRDDRPSVSTPMPDAATPAAPLGVRWSPVDADVEPTDVVEPGAEAPHVGSVHAEAADPRPAGEDTREPGPVRAEPDARDVVARMRSEALAAASTAYADAHGHPLDRNAAPPRRRWSLSVRHAVVAGIAVVVLAAGVVVRAVVAVPDPPEPLAVTAAADGAAAGEAAGPAGASDAAVGAGAGAGPAGGAASGASPPGASPAGAAGAPVAPTGAVPDAGRVVVHVVGQVGRPGVVELPTGSRVADALAVAGGATPAADLSAVNLARVVGDGEQIVVPAPGEVPPTGVVPAPAGPAGGGTAGPSAGGSPAGAAAVDLNTAGLGELDQLPGIGPVLAQRILEWRMQNGPFRRVDELGEVSGIGDALLQRLAPLVRV